MTLRLLCFNIHGCRDLGKKRDLGRLRALLNEHEIDIGIFQEFETRESKGGKKDDLQILSGPERPYHVMGPSLVDRSGWYGNLIISRYPILRGLAHNLETKAQYEPRCAVDALIQSPLGKIRIIGTHLSLARWERFSEVKNLMTLIDKIEEEEKHPVFLLGDMNEWRKTSELIKHLDSLMTPIELQATFPSFYPVLKLDRAWHDTSKFQISAKVLSDKNIRKLSDHLPILVEIEPP